MCVGNAEYKRQLTAIGSQPALIAAIRSGSFPSRRRHLAHVPTRHQNVVKKALAPDMADRYATVLDLMNALAQVDESLDWAYTEGAAWGEGIWYESDGLRARRVELSTGSGWTVHAARISPQGRERACSGFCTQGASETDARRLVKRALTEPWP
jgi:hypothetical protein